MSRRDDLIALRDAVEAERWGFDEWFNAMAVWPDNLVDEAAWSAYQGSTDAALALLAAVLPGWNPSLGRDLWNYYWRASIKRVGDDGLIEAHGAESDDSLARALLLAILAALIEREP